MEVPNQTHNGFVQELLELQALQRTAHLTADATSMADLFTDDFVSISNGKISRPSLTQNLQRLQAYFDQVTFLAWDDVTPPQIRVSDDASLATVIVHKHVHLRYADDSGVLFEEETTFVWHETYIREHSRWHLTTIVSTNTESTTRPAEVEPSRGT